MSGQLRSLQALLRLGVLYAALIFVGESALISFREGFWSLQLKTILCAAGLTPPIIASICFWLYDRRVLRPFRPPFLRVFQLTVVVLLFLPCFWIAMRNSAFSQEQIRVLNPWALLLWLPGFVGIAASVVLKLRDRRAFGTYLLDVFWKPLSLDTEEEPLVMDERIREDRAKQYSDKRAVTVFQGAYLGTIQEAISAAALIASARAIAAGSTTTGASVICQEKLRTAKDALGLDRLRVLDVGCATGKFTAEALARLGREGVEVERVVGVDPAGFREEYQNTMASQLGLNAHQIEYCEAKWQNVVFDANKNFNVVFFSHSLYEALDNSRGDGADLWDSFGALFSSLNDISLWVVVLACASSRAYEFKRRFLHECYGRQQEDATFESFLGAVGRWARRDGLQRLGDAKRIETFFLMPREREERLLFGQYFLRCPIDGDAELRFEELLHEYAVRSKTLNSLATGAALSQAREVNATVADDAELLMHRTQLGLYLCQLL